MPADVLYTDPAEVYAAFESCPRLVKAGVRHRFGSIEEKPAGVGLRAIWDVEDLDPRPPRQPRYTIIQPGPDGAKREYTAECKHDVVVSVKVALFAEVNGPVTPFGLFALYLLAGADVLRIEADYSLRAKVEKRDQLSTATETLRCVLQFRIPVFDLIPSARVADDSVAFRSP